MEDWRHSEFVPWILVPSFFSFLLSFLVSLLSFLILLSFLVPFLMSFLLFLRSILRSALSFPFLSATGSNLNFSELKLLNSKFVLRADFVLADFVSPVVSALVR